MRVVVTGGTGFIGSALVDELCAAGHDVFTIARNASTSKNARGHLACAVECPEVRPFFGQSGAIVHLAGLADASASIEAPFTCAHTHSAGTLNVLEAAREGGSTVVLASSQRVYRPSALPLAEDAPKSPLDPYGYSKLVAETWAEMYNRLLGGRAVALRFFSVYGPGQRVQSRSSGVVSILMQRALRGDDLHVRRGVYRDFTFVDDVVRGIALALSTPQAAGETYNIATGRATSLEELAWAVKDVTGSASAVKVGPAPEVEESYVADVAKAKRELGYEARIGLREGLRRYAEWLQNTAQG